MKNHYITTLFSLLIITLSGCTTTQPNKQHFNKNEILPNIVGYNSSKTVIKLDDHLADTTILLFWDPAQHTEWLHSLDKLLSAAQAKEVNLEIIAVSFKTSGTGHLVKSHKAAKEVSMLYHTSDIIFSYADHEIRKSYKHIKAPTIIVTNNKGQYVASFNKLRDLGKYFSKQKT
ncbi:hypothetical protein [Pseudoalteromonas sp. MMG012]|uniref:hypothetical protein n=1 Tax=Pseudoalteromonas sp. MMG012 TaxID=2822686 RepID=UPI001B39D412|nr:hypothetical protein [Pseudoalteromonas sp. MMG012]MBQ4850603.1 hypothetical protein [Pseudoalteromonas sp. MMG012]